MDLKIFGMKMNVSLLISLVTLAIVLFTCGSCCHSTDVVEAMTGKKAEGHENIHNTQTKMPGTVVNVAQPSPVTPYPHTVPQHMHQPHHTHNAHPKQAPINLNINLKEKKKNGNSDISTTTSQASVTDASTTGEATTEGFSTLDGTTDSQWMNGALNYATGMKNEDHTQSGINDNYNAEDWTPDHTLSIFSNNTKKASCCATSAYSVNSACPCITSEQFNYLSSRGGNHSNGDI